MVADADRFKPALWINSGSAAGLFDLNADTTRRAAFVRSHTAAPRHVFENQRGRVNKVVLDPQDSQEGWFAFLRQPLLAPTEL